MTTPARLFRRGSWAETARIAEQDSALTQTTLHTLGGTPVPVPGGVVRGEYAFTNDARRDIPSTIIATVLALTVACGGTAGSGELMDDNKGSAGGNAPSAGSPRCSGRAAA